MTRSRQQFREKIVRILRACRLLSLYNAVKFQLIRMRYAGDNRRFRESNPDFAVPPLALAYDAYSHLSLSDYKRTGELHGAFIATLIREHAPNATNILEWGCGPARLLRHLEGAFDHPVHLTGTDYNPDTIQWCRRALPGIRFIENGLEPPLPLDDASFDAVFVLSVFTHLSAAMHHAWRDELLRVLRPGGILILSTHGNRYRNHHLLADEKIRFDRGELIVRGNVEEGKKWFAAFHPPIYVRNVLLKPFEILQHTEHPIPGSLEQDVWVARKPHA